MRRTATLALMLFLVACDTSPTEVYVDMTTSAMFGDRDGFLAGFTKDSKKLVKALISLSEAYSFHDENPYEMLVFETVISEKIGDDDETAILKVKTGAAKAKILMVKEDDQWRIDIDRLHAYWSTGKVDGK